MDPVTFAIVAVENNAAGYRHELCYECIVGSLTKIIHWLTISQSKDGAVPLPTNGPDCSGALVDASFANPAAITYNSAGSSVTVAAGFADIFTHSQTTDCPVTACILKD